MSVVIETTVGDITVDLYTSDRPRACLNFLKLCKIKYYNYNLFHTISRGFIAQTGDPSGSRSGGESVYGVLDGPEKRYFEGENEPRIKHTKMGLISFVGNEDRMIGSQFFLTLGEDLTYLDEKHCVFGEVVEGHDVLEVINEIICDNDDRPYQDVRITHTVILDDPFPNPKKLIIPERSPSPSAERLKGGRIAPDEEIDEYEGKAPEEINEMRAEREAKARATILEMVGDLPDAEMAPPENVLFVCKLNPVTNDDDLEIIFSRFGKIKSCEVIRDKKTGDSLQYAFVEFEDKAACENAYFKMDNVLIDDRRIHVDFSQSVSKVKWRGKGRGVTHYNEKGEKSRNIDSEIGKGNYKLRKSDSFRNIDNKSKNRNRSRSPINKIKNNSKYEKEKSSMPNRNRNRDNYDRDYSKLSKNYDRRSRRSSRSPERSHSRYSKSPPVNEYKYRSSDRGKYYSQSNRDGSNSIERERNNFPSRRTRENGQNYNSSKRNRSVSPRRKRSNSPSSNKKRDEKVNPKRRSKSLSPNRRSSYEKSDKYDKSNKSVRKTPTDKSTSVTKKIKKSKSESSESDSDSAVEYEKTKKSNKSIANSKKNSVRNKKSSPKSRSSSSKSKHKESYDSDEESVLKKEKKKRKKSHKDSSSEDSSSDSESERKHTKKKKTKNGSRDSDYKKQKSKRKSIKKHERDASSDSDNYKKRTKKRRESSSD